jgi:hypothetical protein
MGPSYNQYDVAMNNQIQKVDNDFMGNTNALINKNATDIITELFDEKVAYYDPYNNDDDDDDNGRDDFKRYYSDRNYNPRDLKSDGFGAYLPYAVLGSAAVDLGAYQAYKTGNIGAPLESAVQGFKKGLEKGMLAGPKKMLKSTKTGKLMLDSIGQGWKGVKKLDSDAIKAAEKARKEAERIQREADRLSRMPKKFGKYASEEIDEMYKEAYASFDNKKQFVKTLVQEDFLQNGLKALPYATVPIALSYAVNKNLKTDNSPVRGADKNTVTPGDRIIVDVPMESLNRSKKASEYLSDLMEQEKVAYEPIPWKHFFKYEMPRQAVRAASWTVLPATAIALTGRNIRGMGEKITRDEKKGPVSPGMARITIEAGPSDNHYDRKAALTIDEMYKEAAKKKVLSDGEEAYLEATDQDKREQIPFARKKITLLEKQKMPTLK